jgi:hypothetical protein
VIRASCPEENNNAKIPNYHDNLEGKRQGKRQKTVPLGMAYAKDGKRRTESGRRKIKSQKGKKWSGAVPSYENQLF